MRMRPAVLAEEEEGAPQPVFKWTGNANMATVGEWKRSGVQATGSAGGRLSVGGVLEEKEGGRGWGVSLGMSGLYKHPVSLPRLLHHSGNVWRGSQRKLSDGFTPALPQHRCDCSRVMTRSNLLHQKL